MSHFNIGPFELDATRLELRRDGVKLRVGARACRVLLALVERAGSVVSQAELMAAAWSGLHVEDVNLRVHVFALRRVLSGGSDGVVDITTVPREGYVLVAPISEIGAGGAANSDARQPRLLAPLVGRSDALKRLDEALAAHRIVTVTGPAGIGKTALAQAVCAERRSQLTADCIFIDFSTSVSSLQVAGCIFSALELEGAPNDVLAHIVRAIKGRSILLVFDNCEHVIDPVARIAVELVSSVEGVAILATSREPLRVPRECVFPVEPLSCPLEGEALTARSAMNYAAVKLFVETASMRSHAFFLDDGGASLVGDICRRLDGIPLAIELAAAAVDTMTVSELARHLDDRFAVLTRGTRTALPRHRTLQAALDWSYDDLGEEDALVMRRLSVFPGRFSAEDAKAIAAADALTAVAVRNGLAELAAKSLLTVDVDEDVASFRFLESMRVYAKLKLLESGDAPEVAARFIDHTLARLTEIHGSKRTAAELRLLHHALIDDWRAAHDWATRSEDWRTALNLLVAGIGFCQSLNIKAEYVDRSASTLRAVPSGGVDVGALRAELLVRNHQALMLSDTQPLGPSPFFEQIEATALRALDLSARLDDGMQKMRALVALIVAANTTSETTKLLKYTGELEELAADLGDADVIRTAHRLSGGSAYYSADFNAAVRRCDEALIDAAPPKVSASHVPTVRLTRARALWVRGEFQAGLAEMDEAHRAAVAGGHPTTTTYVAWAGGMCVYLWAGDVDRAAASAQLFEDIARECSNPGWARYVPTFRDAIARLGEGRRSFGLGPLDWTAHSPYHADIMTSVHCAFHRTADLQRMEAAPGHWCAAEHLRAAGEHHLAAGRAEEGEGYLLRALATSEAQGAVAWEVRAKLSLARLRLQQGEPGSARALLEPLTDRFADWRVNADLVLATELLADC